jgi:feruloyl esterase
MKYAARGLSTLLMLGTTLAAAAQSTETGTTKPCMPCAEISNLHLPDVDILSAEQRSGPVPHCMISGTIGGSAYFELGLPDAWNERFSMSGNGGFAGSVQTGHGRIREGFANAATDTGHRGEATDCSWALNDPEAQLNFGHLAVHRTTVTAKAIVRHYYGREAKYSYFVGCSRGGGQALMEAQRYPDDFDGILAGAPAFNWTEFAAEHIRNLQANFPGGGDPNQPIIDEECLQTLQKEVLAQCDALDGIEDGIISNPLNCHIDFSAFAPCAADKPSDGCLTTGQIAAIQTVYAATFAGQREIHPGFPPGCESERGGWWGWITGNGQRDADGTQFAKHFAFGPDIFRYFVYNDPDWDYRAYDFNDFNTKTAFAAAILDATSTDYSAFKARGGKMIIYHGWNDPALSALATIRHYEEALKVDANISEAVRLFLLPGVLHCGRGPGPSHTDWLGHLIEWVETGNPPEKVLMTKNEKRIVLMTRPVFPYPNKAVYDGKGDPNAAASFYMK